jgi:hypothetical protein
MYRTPDKKGTNRGKKSLMFSSVMLMVKTLHRRAHTGKILILTFSVKVVVHYHCGGWSEEVNSCILISYMVYL